MSENPYAAPQADLNPAPVEPPSGAMISPYGPYQDIGVLQKIVLGLLGVASLLALGNIYALIKLNEANLLPDDDPSSEEKVDQAWTLSDQLGTADGVFLLLIIIFWCFWKNKSCKNAWAFLYHEKGRDAIVIGEMTPGWAVGWYFVPIFNFFKPYQAMAFIRDAVSTQSRITNMLPYWWLTWLLIAHVGSIYLSLIGKSWIIDEEVLEIDDLILYNQSLMIDSASYFLSCVFAMVVIYQISEGQKRKARQLKMGEAFFNPLRDRSDGFRS